jgi:uncharacterized protein (DUF779 family)
MAAQGAGPAVLATAAARSAIAHLRTVVGPVMFVQYAGSRRVTVPMCLPLGEYLPGVQDLLLGEIDGCPYYIDAAHYAACGRPTLVLDVQPGIPEGFSLSAGDGLEFLVRTARTNDPLGSTPCEGTVPHPRKANQS